MKCICCNKGLSDYEATRRHGLTNEFLDLCNGCLSEVQALTTLPTVDNPDHLNGPVVDIEQESADMEHEGLKN